MDRTCKDILKCDGYILCPWLSPHDEANCLHQCPSSSRPFPCNCNKPGNMTCEGEGLICYNQDGNILVLFISANVTMTIFINVTIVV